MTHPLTLITGERFTVGESELKLHISGKKPWNKVIDDQTTLKCPELKSKRDKEIAKLSDDKAKTPWDKTDVVFANFAAAMYRDTRYAAAGRRFHQYTGFAGMLRGYYAGAKWAADHELE